MGHFTDKPDNIENTLMIDSMTDCGTLGCMAGHGPFLGIIKSSDESWFDYSIRVFGLKDYFSEETDDAYSSWNFVFSSKWRNFDNTPEGAEDRLEHLLEVGITPRWAFHEYMQDWKKRLDESK